MRQSGGGELGHVELAQQHRSGLFQAGDDGGVVPGHEVVEHRGAAGGANALGVHLVFDRDGHAVERAAILAAGNLRLGVPGCLPRQVGG